MICFSRVAGICFTYITAECIGFKCNPKTSTQPFWPRGVKTKISANQERGGEGRR